MTSRIRDQSMCVRQAVSRDQHLRGRFGIVAADFDDWDAGALEERHDDLRFRKRSESGKRHQVADVRSMGFRVGSGVSAHVSRVTSYNAPSRSRLGLSAVQIGAATDGVSS